MVVLDNLSSLYLFNVARCRKGIEMKTYSCDGCGVEMDSEDLVCDGDGQFLCDVCYEILLQREQENPEIAETEK